MKKILLISSIAILGFGCKKIKSKNFVGEYACTYTVYEDAYDAMSGFPDHTYDTITEFKMETVEKVKDELKAFNVRVPIKELEYEKLYTLYNYNPYTHYLVFFEDSVTFEYDIYEEGFWGSNYKQIRVTGTKVD